MLTVNDLHAPGGINQHFQSGSMKRMAPFYERPDEERRSEKRPRWENNNQKCKSISEKTD
jgi:hypothetical protein